MGHISTILVEKLAELAKPETNDGAFVNHLQRRFSTSTKTKNAPRGGVFSFWW